ncbi:polyamine-modulated factor 1-binding protein 1 isoform X1 [Amborella trichopoda]|nr:polyamine-modulated factor 1-binding protein 1 isoform X1 [Amborella trichopoda]|eukprot:XP_011628041.1 polyamine-modulated factor 1-binding protein 1 isoform X1 [Amborella trichopoda]
MGERGNNKEALALCVEQLERERDELRKDIEQLCMQQSGPGYLGVVGRIYLQRTAGLEQEIENLKKKLAGCNRDYLNLQEELSEVYRIKSQLADLHSAEVEKNKEAEKQVKFFQGCVAAAFAERDHSLMEAESAIEREEAMSNRLNDLQKRFDQLTEEYLQEKRINAELQKELIEAREEVAHSEQVIDKFYQIKQRALGCMEAENSEDMASCLLQDPEETWSFGNHRETSAYIASLEEELKTLRDSLANFKKEQQERCKSEETLRRSMSLLEEKRALLEERTRKGLSMLHHFHVQSRGEIISLLEQEKIHLKTLVEDFFKRTTKLCMINGAGELQRNDGQTDDIECRDVHITSYVDPSNVMEESDSSASPRFYVEGKDDISSALAQALQEKVATLLLLSQEEERHLLEKNVNAALEKKLGELQKMLYQVTNEKVEALMELAQLRQEHQMLQATIGHGTKQYHPFGWPGVKNIIAHERDGRLKSLLKRTYLKRWMGEVDIHGNQANVFKNDDGSTRTPKNAVDIARLKIENATLQEGMASLEHLTSSIHRLRLALVQAKDIARTTTHAKSTVETLDGIVVEANHLKTALGSSLPLSWSSETDPLPFEDQPELSRDLKTEKLDSITAVGLELVELLLMATQLQKDEIVRRLPEQEADFR